MEHVRGAQAVREAKSIDDLDARVATGGRKGAYCLNECITALPDCHLRIDAKRQHLWTDKCTGRSGAIMDISNCIDAKVADGHEKDLKGVTGQSRPKGLSSPKEQAPLLLFDELGARCCVLTGKQLFNERACGQWDRALEVAEKHDRIHLKTIHYTHAQQALECCSGWKLSVQQDEQPVWTPTGEIIIMCQFLEKTGDFEGAKMAYTKSGCGPVEITRMLFQAGRFTDLEQYIASQVRPLASMYYNS
eukprot:1161913-Pelagomonas_calceolata.AAC.13